MDYSNLLIYYIGKSNLDIENKLFKVKELLSFGGQAQTKICLIPKSVNLSPMLCYLITQHSQNHSQKSVLRCTF